MSHSDRITDTGFKKKTVHLNSIFFYEKSGKTLEQFLQGDPSPASIHGRVGQVPEQLGLDEAVPGHGRGIGRGDL